MSAKVYVLLNVTGGKPDEVAQTLRRKPGVVTVDLLEDPPDIVMVVETSTRQKLAELTIQALASVEAATQDVQLLPTRAARRGQHAVKKPPPPAESSEQRAR